MAELRGTVFHIPEAQATAPAEGYCILDRWWAVHPEKGLAFYAQLRGYARSEEPSPQCNPSEATMRALAARIHPDHEVKHIPLVFFEHAEREMARLRKESSNG